MAEAVKTKKVKVEEVQAIARYIRTSPLKARRMLSLIRGKSIAEARSILHIMPHRAARLAEKVLNSAVANASNNHKMNKDALIVSRAFADQAFIMKRIRAASRGRAMSIHKKLSHITVMVREALVKEKK